MQNTNSQQSLYNIPPHPHPVVAPLNLSLAAHVWCRHIVSCYRILWMMYVNSKYSLSKVTSSYKLIDIFPERRRRRRLGHSPTHLQTQLPPPIHHPFPLLLYMTLPLLYTALYPAGPLSTRKCHHDYFISIQCDLGDNIVRLLRPHSHQIPGFSWYALFFMQEEVCIKKCSLCPSPSTPTPSPSHRLHISCIESYGTSKVAQH